MGYVDQVASDPRAMLSGLFGRKSVSIFKEALDARTGISSLSANMSINRRKHFSTSRDIGRCFVFHPNGQPTSTAMMRGFVHDR
jgi:hypothetical protein